MKSEDLVVGDVVCFEAGDTVPADCRLLEAHSLKAEEAALVYAGIAERYAGDPVAEKARFMQGRALGLCGKAAEAADVYREVAKAGGAYAAEATLSCAAYDSESGRTDEALAAYTKLIKDPAVKPTVVVDATIGRGRTLYRAYRFTDARSDFDAAAKADPSRADSMRFLSALCEYGLGRDEEAKKLAEAVLADFPRSPLAPEIALYNTAVIHAKHLLSPQ